MKKNSLAQQVYEELLEKLYSGGLAPGTLLNRRAVALSAGVSPAPALEAMLRLEHEGLLVTIPRKGTQVRILRQADVRDSMILREALECQAARCYCGKPLRRRRAQLLPLATALDRNRSKGLERTRLEIGFHRALITLAESPLLTEQFDRVMNQVLFFKSYTEEPARGANPAESHEELLAVLATVDADPAEQAMRKHLHATTANE